MTAYCNNIRKYVNVDSAHYTTTVTSLNSLSISNSYFSTTKISFEYDNLIYREHGIKIYEVPESSMIKYMQVHQLITDGDPIVKALWDRLQVAVKLIGSPNDESEKPGGS